MNLIDNLYRLNELKKELKRYTDIFQVDLKCSASAWWDKPYDSFFELDYNQWLAIRTKYFKETEEFFDNFEEICKYNGVDRKEYSKTPIFEIKHFYFNWKKGLDK